MSPSIQSLKELSINELIAEHDKLAENTVVGIDYYLSELRHRGQAETNQKVEKSTKLIFWFTAIVTVATVINLGLFVAQFYSTFPTP